MARGKTDPGHWERRLKASTTADSTNGQIAVPLLPIRWLVRGGVALFMHTYVRVHAVGRAHIPSAGPFILAPNHASHLDAPSVITAVGGKRRVWVAGAEDYFFSTPMKRFLFGKVLDTIAFDRRADGVRGLQRCGDALRLGDGLLLFPEGTRSISGALQPFRTGVAVLAVQRNLPIVPVHIDRTFVLLRKGHRIIRPGRTTVRFGEPIYPPPHEETSDHYEIFRTLTAQVESAVIELTREALA